MSWLEALIQGLIQGFTEFLPVSSSGHLSLFQHFSGITGSESLFFSVMLHLGTLIAVCITFYKTIWDMIVEFFVMIGDIFTGRLRATAPNESRKAVVMLLITIIPLVLLYPIRDFFAGFSEDNDIVIEGCCFLITGVLLLLMCLCVKGKKTAINMKPRNALILGITQGIAAMPGISRSGSTTAMGVLQGFSKEFAIQFSFIMGIPVILGTSASELLDVVKGGGVSTPMSIILIGIVTATLSGLVAIALVRWLMKTDKYWIFCAYTLLLGAATLILGVLGY